MKRSLKDWARLDPFSVAHQPQPKIERIIDDAIADIDELSKAKDELITHNHALMALLDRVRAISTRIDLSHGISEPGPFLPEMV